MTEKSSGERKKLSLSLEGKLSLKNSVNSKISYGGTSTKNIKKMISKLKKEFK